CPVNTFGVQCHECHCKTACDRETGSCTRCMEGWHGPNCQMKNVGLKQKTKARIYGRNYGEETVNGRRDDCTLLTNSEEVMRLRIILEKNYNINGITVFTNSSVKSRSKMDGFDIVLSETEHVGAGTVCYTQSEEIAETGRIDTSCRGRATTVFIRKKYPPYFLFICEVEIY
ncbi:uncharacterized protein LOC134255930, partial [Saccostrea cucullata]|uniref:uncharacterized protein LOC134255930 n=1 Tax=Saccostrea cuccullata TaxID=36930 RepID=UPI002ED5A26C